MPPSATLADRVAGTDVFDAIRAAFAALPGSAPDIADSLRRAGIRANPAEDRDHPLVLWLIGRLPAAEYRALQIHTLRLNERRDSIVWNGLSLLLPAHVRAFVRDLADGAFPFLDRSR